VFGNQAFFKRQQITSITGETTQFARLSDTGRSVSFRFCPVCGSTVYWEFKEAPDFIAVAIGAFADPNFPPPRVSVYEARMHPWVSTGELPLERRS